jgi:hypothetical protein
MELSRSARWWLIAASAVLLPTSIVYAAGIVTDGGTATTVSTAASGHQTVNIAPATGGVSHNTYTTFNVGSAGASLNNNGINATTIVNQVTGTSASALQGALAVTGPTCSR